jgi:hypothetical protein
MSGAEKWGLDKVWKEIDIIHGRRCKKVSRVSSVSTVTDYGLDGRGSIPDRGRGFLL